MEHTAVQRSSSSTNTCFAVRSKSLLQFPTVTEGQLDAMVPLGKAAELLHVKTGPHEELYRAGAKRQPWFFTSDNAEVRCVTDLTCIRRLSGTTQSKLARSVPAVLTPWRSKLRSGTAYIAESPVVFLMNLIYYRRPHEELYKAGAERHP